jgi:hypothetical protein
MADFSSFTDDEVHTLSKAMCAGFAEQILDSRNPVHDVLDHQIWDELLKRGMKDDSSL